MFHNFFIRSLDLILIKVAHEDHMFFWIRCKRTHSRSWMSYRLQHAHCSIFWYQPIFDGFFSMRLSIFPFARYLVVKIHLLDTTFFPLGTHSHTKYNSLSLHPFHLLLVSSGLMFHSFFIRSWDLILIKISHEDHMFLWIRCKRTHSLSWMSYSMRTVV